MNLQEWDTSWVEIRLHSQKSVTSTPVVWSHRAIPWRFADHVPTLSKLTKSIKFCFYVCLLDRCCRETSTPSIAISRISDKTKWRPKQKRRPSLRSFNRPILAATPTLCKSPGRDYRQAETRIPTIIHPLVHSFVRSFVHSSFIRTLVLHKNYKYTGRSPSEVAFRPTRHAFLHYEVLQFCMFLHVCMWIFASFHLTFVDFIIAILFWQSLWCWNWNPFRCHIIPSFASLRSSMCFCCLVFQNLFLSKNQHLYWFQVESTI